MFTYIIYITMANKWIEHIKKWAKDNNSTYGCALSNPKCKEDYKKSKEEPKQEEKFKRSYEEDIKEIKSELNHPEDRAKRDEKINIRTMQYYVETKNIDGFLNNQNIKTYEKSEFLQREKDKDFKEKIALAMFANINKPVVKQPEVKQIIDLKLPDDKNFNFIIPKEQKEKYFNTNKINIMPNNFYGKTKESETTYKKDVDDFKKKLKNAKINFV